MNLSVIIPIYNESSNISELARRVIIACSHTTESYELILVDDGSWDNSASLLKEIIGTYSTSNIIIVSLTRNFGQHNAIMAGFSVASGEKIITLDGDLQNPPEEIPTIYKKLCEGYEVVNTIRLNRDDNFIRKSASKIINWGMRKLCKVNDVHDFGCMLRGYSRTIVDSMLQCKDYGIFIPMLALSFTHNCIEIEVHHCARNSGNSKYSLSKLIALQYDLLISSSTIPLRLLTLLGFIIAFCGIVFGVIIFILSLVNKGIDSEGIFVLFSIMLVLIGGLFAAIGLLGEYIGKIYLNTRNHPTYIIQSISKMEKN